MVNETPHWLLEADTKWGIPFHSSILGDIYAVQKHAKENPGTPKNADFFLVLLTMIMIRKKKCSITYQTEAIFISTKKAIYI